MGLKQFITENQDNTKTPLLSPLPQSFQSDDECSELSTLSLNIDKIVESLQVGPFHYIFLVVCGLCYAGYYLCYNTIGFIIITACDLHIHAANKGWLSLSYMAGLAASSLITGRLCDRFGRRKILIITMTIHLIGIITAALSYNYTMLLITFAIIGTCDSGVLAATSTYSVEFFPRSHRAMASGTRVIISIIAIVYVSLIALLILPHHFNLYVGAIHISSWRIFILICVIPVIPAYIILFYMPESLRFVITTGKIENVVFVLDRINRINSLFKRNCSPSQQNTRSMLLNIVVDCDKDAKYDISEKVSSNNDQYSGKLYKRPWVTRTIALCLVWIGAGLTIEGFTMWLPTIVSFYTGGNKCRYYSHNSSLPLKHPSQHTNKSFCSGEIELIPVITNILLSNLLTVPFSFLFLYLVNRVGRKLLSILLITATGLSVFLIWLFDNTLSTVILVCFFSIFANCSWIPLITWCLELFPTTKRGTVVGFVNISYTITCGLGMTIVATIFTSNCTATLLLFSSLCIAASLVCIILPDTTKSDIG